MPTSVLEAICTAPTSTNGVATGESDWRFVVEVLTGITTAIAGSSRVGSARVGSAKVGSSGTSVGEYVWLDVTADVQGVTWIRGSASVSAGMPNYQAGTSTLYLRNESHEYSAYYRGTANYREWCPGAIFRYATSRPSASTSYSTTNSITTVTRTNWYPLYTGIVESWDEHITDAGISTVIITLAEPASLIAGADTDAVASVGSGDKLSARVARLSAFDSQTWEFGIQFAAGYSASNYETTHYLQATTITGNRWQEILSAGTSIADTKVSCGTDGALLIGFDVDTPTAPVHFGTSESVEPTILASYPSLVYAKYQPPLVLTNNPDFVINDATVQRVGGTAYNSQSADSIAAFGLRSYRFTTSMSNNDTTSSVHAAFLVATYSGIGASFAYKQTDQTLQPGEITVTNQHSAQRYLKLYDVCRLDYSENGATTPLVRFRGRIKSMEHVISPLNNSIHWQTTYTMLATANYLPSEE